MKYSKWRGRDRSRGNEEEMRNVKGLDENRENGEEGKEISRKRRRRGERRGGNKREGKWMGIDEMERRRREGNALRIDAAGGKGKGS